MDAALGIMLASQMWHVLLMPQTQKIAMDAVLTDEPPLLLCGRAWRAVLLSLVPWLSLQSYYLGLVHHRVTKPVWQFHMVDMAAASHRHPHAHCNLPPEHSCNSTAAGHHARFARGPELFHGKSPSKNVHTPLLYLPSSQSQPLHPWGRSQMLEVPLSVGDLSCRQT